MHRTALLARTRIGSNARRGASLALAGVLAAAFLLLLAPDAGAQGFLRNYVVLSDTAESEDITARVRVECPDGLQVLGGGVRGLGLGLGIITSIPESDDGDRWNGRVQRFGNIAPVIEAEVAVVCGRVENYSRPTNSLTSSSTTPKALTVNCPPGSSVLGGGVVRTPVTDLIPVAVTSSKPSGNGWFGRADEVSATDENWGIQVYAICGVVPNHIVLEDQFGLLNSVDSKTTVSPSCEELVPLSGGASIGFDFREAISDLFPTEGGRWTSSAFEPTVHLEDWNLRTSVICAPEPGAATLALGAITTVGLVAQRRRRAQLAETGSDAKRRR